MTKKLWFQAGIAILIILFIIKYTMEIQVIFNPVIIIFKTILIPLLLGGVLYYIPEPLQRLLEKRGVPRWGSLLTVLIILIGLIAGFLFLIGDPISKQVTNLVDNAPQLADKLEDAANYITDNRENLPPQVGEFIDSVEVYDRKLKQFSATAAKDCDFAYRHSIFKETAHIGIFLWIRQFTLTNMNHLTLQVFCCLFIRHRCF